MQLRDIRCAYRKFTEADIHMEMFSSGYKRLSGVIKTTDWSLQENTSEVIFIAEAVGALSVWAHRHHSSTCQPDLHLSMPALLCLSFPLATLATLPELQCRPGILGNEHCYPLLNTNSPYQRFSEFGL